MQYVNRYVKEREERIRLNNIAQSVLQKVFAGNEEKKSEINLQNTKNSTGFEKEDPKASLKSIEQARPSSHQVLIAGVMRNENYGGELTKRELDLIQKNFPAYFEASQKTQVNWRVLAALHYRETHLSLHPQTHSNPFQFDGVYKNKVSGSLLKDAITAGNILQAKTQFRSSKYNLHPVAKINIQQLDGENLRQALFRYNGPVYKTPNRSPYVMNRWDEAHQNMPLYKGNNQIPRWGIDKRLGVLALIKEINSAFPDIK